MYIYMYVIAHRHAPDTPVQLCTSVPTIRKNDFIHPHMFNVHSTLFRTEHTQTLPPIKVIKKA